MLPNLVRDIGVTGQKVRSKSVDSMAAWATSSFISLCMATGP